MPQTLKTIKPEEFENLTFDLLQKLGMKNCIWRTPGRDGGRDIQGNYYLEDISGYTQKQIWYIECKRHNSSISWPTIWEKISYAESNSADVLLIVTSSSLSPQAVDEVNKWNKQKKMLTIRFWNSSDIDSKLQLYPALLMKYRLTDNPIKESSVALMPVVKIMLKYSDSTHSAHVFGTNIDKKISVIHSLSELITNRMLEFEKSHHLIINKYLNKKDGYEWLDGGKHAEQAMFDKYAFRALVCYVRDISKKDVLTLSFSENKFSINTDICMPHYAINDINELTLLSNIRVTVDQNILLLEREGL